MYVGRYIVRVGKGEKVVEHGGHECKFRKLKVVENNAEHSLGQDKKRIQKRVKTFCGGVRERKGKSLVEWWVKVIYGDLCSLWLK